MRSFIITCLTVLLVGLAVPGCTTPIAPGADPVVVNTERGINASFDIADAFVQFDHNNLALMKSQYPAAHNLAQQTRKTYPSLYAEVWQLHDTYKTVKSPQAAGALNQALERLNSLVALIRTTWATVHTPGNPTTQPSFQAQTVPIPGS